MSKLNNPHVQPQIKKPSRPSIDIRSLQQKTVSQPTQETSIVKTIIENANNDSERSSLENLLKSKQSKKSYVDQHTRDTFYLENDVFATLHNLIDQQHKNKGLKSQIINEAFKLYFEKNSIDMISFEDYKR